MKYIVVVCSVVGLGEMGLGSHLAESIEQVGLSLDHSLEVELSLVNAQFAHVAQLPFKEVPFVVF